MPKTIVSTSILEAMQNTHAECPFQGKFDPAAVEIHGFVPKDARGLLVFARSQQDHIAKLKQQIAAATLLAESAQGMATSIILDENPALFDRQGIAFAEEWQFFATGPSAERQAQRDSDEVFDHTLQTEAQRKETGDDSVDHPSLAEMFGGREFNIIDLVKLAGRGGRVRMTAKAA